MSEHNKTVQDFVDVTDGVCDEIKVAVTRCPICAIHPPFEKHSCCGAWVCHVCIVRSKHCGFCQAENALFDEKKSDEFSAADVAENMAAELSYQAEKAAEDRMMLQSFVDDAFVFGTTFDDADVIDLT